MKHLVVDCSTGEQAEIPWTSEEVAAHEAHVAGQLEQEQPRDLHAELDALRDELETLKAERS